MQLFVKIIRKSFLLLIVSAFLLSSIVSGFEDHTFYSKEFQSDRFYRIYLPSDYHQNNDKEYPVIYYFHGWSGRYKWEAYSISAEPYHKGKARNHPPFIMEWETYVKNHDVIIVTWDGYEPKYQPGIRERDSIKYDECAPYDYLRAHNLNKKIRGLNYSTYFKELVAHIDSTYRTIPNRNNRAISGLSMGGLMANYIAGQNKDLVSSISSFCPADNYPLFGVKGEQVVFPILEMYRSLKGLDVRLTMTDGDWLKYNDIDMNQLWSVADLTHYEFHVAHFHDHFAADTDEQLDFHMKHFTKSVTVPQSWDYIAPGYPSFKIFGYEIDVKRKEPAHTLVEKIKDGKIKIFARSFLPDGPIVKKESINIKTDLLFSKNTINAYNISTSKFSTLLPQRTEDNKLSFNLNGGGHIIGITGGKFGYLPRITIVDRYNRDYQYFEVDEEYGLDFNVVNIGNEKAENVEITVISQHPYISISENKISITQMEASSLVEEKNKFKFKFSFYDEANSTGNFLLEVKINGVVTDTQKVIYYVTPKSPYVTKNDVIILDGRTVKNIPVFHQERNMVKRDSLSGGIGNGNGILEKGEEALIFIRIPKGISCNDTNTFHKTYILNAEANPFIEVNKLQYDEKIHQAGATSVSSIITVANDLSKNQTFDLWFKIESLYNDYDDPTAINPVYAHKYDYRRVKINE